MSPLVTPLPVDISAVTNTLPKGSHVAGVKWNPQEQRMEIEWSNPELEHPFTFPVEFTLEQIKGRKLPAQVTRRERKVKPTKQKVLTAPNTGTDKENS